LGKRKLKGNRELASEPVLGKEKAKREQRTRLRACLVKEKLKGNRELASEPVW